MAKFADIPQFISCSSYMVNVGLDYLPRHYARYVMSYGLEISPDFQRGNVWTERQKIRFMEYMCRGGQSGMDIYTNSPRWSHGSLNAEDPGAWFVLVDGKQRLDAAIGFISNEFPVFGAYYREYTDKPRITTSNFRWHVNNLKTRKECLQWYLDLNTGGTVHTEEEFNKVRVLIEESPDKYTRPPSSVILSEAGLDRPGLKEGVDEVREEHEKQAAYETGAKAKHAQDLVTLVKGVKVVCIKSKDTKNRLHLNATYTVKGLEDDGRMRLYLEEVPINGGWELDRFKLKEAK